MKNFIQDGKSLTLAAPYAVDSGKGAQIGANLFGVAAVTLANGVVGEFVTEGVFELTKIASQAWVVGDKIYWDNTNKWCTKVASTHLCIGVAIEAVASGAGDVLGKVKLSGHVQAD